jgi:hypothetical protein
MVKTDWDGVVDGMTMGTTDCMTDKRRQEGDPGKVVGGLDEVTVICGWGIPDGWLQSSLLQDIIHSPKIASFLTEV